METKKTTRENEKRGFFEESRKKSFCTPCCLIFFLILFFLTGTGCSKTHTYKIAVPGEEEYINFYGKALPVIKEKLESSGFGEKSGKDLAKNFDLEVIFFNDGKTLEKILKKADKQRLIAAEVPLSYQYDINSLLGQNLSAPVNKEKVPGTLLPAALANASRQEQLSRGKTETTGSTLRYLPFTFDPYFIFTNTEKPGKDTVIFIPSKTTKESLIALGAAGFLTGEQGGTETLSRLQKEHKLQTNASTYNLYDSMETFLSTEKGSHILLSLSQKYRIENNSIKIAGIPDLGGLSVNKNLTLMMEETALVIPSKAGWQEEEIQKITDCFYSKEINSLILQERKNLSCIKEMPFIDFHGNLAKTLAFSAEDFILPLLKPATQKEAEELQAEVQKALSGVFEVPSVYVIPVSRTTYLKSLS